MVSYVARADYTGIQGTDHGTAICPKQNQSYIQISLYFCLISSIYIAGRGKVYIEINTFERSHLKSREGQNRLSCENLYTDLHAYSDTGYSDNLATVTFLAFPKVGI